MLRFPRELFLRALCAVYVAAFVSIRAQIRGLYGEDGLESVAVFLAKLLSRDPNIHAATSTPARFWAYPTLVWLHVPLQWSPSFAMEVICLAGATTAVLGVCSARWRTAVPLALVWLCYLSIVQCGQTFTRFQWDAFLLEVGVLAVAIAPWWHYRQRGRHMTDVFETPAAGVWNLRFMFFKFMFMSGSVKIQSQCPTWLGLTALEFHYATQPLPLPLAWHAHQLPPIVNRFAVATTLLFEGPWTFFILAPHLTLRRFAAVTQVLLQIGILLTGNYNFFNIVTVIVALSVLDISMTFSILDRPYQNSMPPLIIAAYERTEKYRIASPYGLFRTMTGVGTIVRGGERVSVVARPEIILEGTVDDGRTWREYHFKHKPGDVFACPSRAMPMQPRLDWQMWFAALGDYNGAPWLVHLVHKLLAGSDDAKALLDTSRDPFPDAPPQAIRAHLYYYDFTRSKSSAWSRGAATPASVAHKEEQTGGGAGDPEISKDQPWWSRVFVREYLPALELGNPSLQNFVEQHYGVRSGTGSKEFQCSHTSAGRQVSESCRMLQTLVRSEHSPFGLAAIVLAAQFASAWTLQTVATLWQRRRAARSKPKPKRE